MKTELYAIYDAATEAYHRPVHFQNEMVAKRTAVQLANDEQSDIYHHSEYFTLFYLGTFEDTTCEFELLDTPKKVVGFWELKEANPRQRKKIIKPKAKATRRAKKS